MPTTKKEPNPPVWPDSVLIVRETDEPVETLRKIQEIAQDPILDGKFFTCDKHFSRSRAAILFAPGSYTYKFEVGYYTQVAGLGQSAQAVRFAENTGPYVPALNKHLHRNPDTGEPVGTCLDTFWRSAENFACAGNLQWAVSQAAPLRRVAIDGDLLLHDGMAYASGGHLANARIGGELLAGGQQQYLVRHVELGGSVVGGAWSMVYVGCTGDVPKARRGKNQGSGGADEDTAAITVVTDVRVRIEKPFVALQDDGIKFELRVPQVQLSTPDSLPSAQPLLDGSLEEARSFERVAVIKPNDPIHSIQTALDEGKDVVLAPGIYSLAKTIEMHKPNQVLLGLGLATLEGPTCGGPCIHVHSGVPGVRIAGIMLEAVAVKTNHKPFALLEWGDSSKPDPGNPENPGALLDVFVRVGGTNPNRASISVKAMMCIHSGNVVADNLWIWRADHAELQPNEKPNYPQISPVFWQTEQNEYRVETGVQVTGDNVTIFGLAVEHANGHQTVWSGQDGQVHFYQCELPYGVDEEYAKQEYRGYLVADTVTSHTIHAPGVYSNFRNANVLVQTAMEHPEARGSISFHNPFTVKLDNQGGILSVLNGQGDATAEKGKPVWLPQTKV